jgi:hypothetical protein
MRSVACDTAPKGTDAMRMFLFLAAFALFGCSPPQTQAPTPPPTPAPAPVIAKDIGAPMTGQWRLAALTGHDLEASQHHPIYLVGLVGRLDLTSQCVPFFFRYQFDETSIVMRDGYPPGAPVCARGLSPIETDLPKIILAAKRAEQRGENAFALIGPAGEAVFVKPAAPVTNPFGNNPDPDEWLLWGEWRVTAVNGKAAEGEPIDVAIGYERIEAYGAGASIGFTYRQELPDLITVDETGMELPVVQPGLSATKTALRAALRGSLTIGGDGPNKRILRGVHGEIELQR